MSEPTALWSLKMRGCRCAGTCPKCNDALKQAQIAALRQRVEDMWNGVESVADSEVLEMMGKVSSVEKAWPQMKGVGLPVPLDNTVSLAAWLWERGIRAG